MILHSSSFPSFRLKYLYLISWDSSAPGGTPTNSWLPLVVNEAISSTLAVIGGFTLFLLFAFLSFSASFSPVDKLFGSDSSTERMCSNSLRGSYTSIPNLACLKLESSRSPSSSSSDSDPYPDRYSTVH